MIRKLAQLWFPWMGRRINIGFQETLVQELKIEVKSKYKKNLLMTPHVVRKILGHIQDDTTKINTNMRDLILANN